MTSNTTFGSGNERNAIKQKSLCTILLLFLVGLAQAQGWEASFGGDKEDQARAILQTVDRGYVTVGFSESFGTDNDLDIYTVRTDVDGTLIWEYVYDEGFIEQGLEIIPVADDGFLIAGFIQESVDSTQKAYLLRIDKRGQQRWSRIYDNGGVDQRISDIIATDDGNFLLVGTTFSPTDDSDVLLILVDELGTELWRSELGTNRDDDGIGVIETAGHYLIAANVQEPGSLFRRDIGFFRARKSDGAQLGSNIIGQPNSTELVADLIVSQNDGVVFVGSVMNQTQAFVAKADVSGDTTALNGGWFKIVDTISEENQFLGVIEEANGIISAVGSADVSVGLGIDILFMQFSSSGDVVLQKQIGYTAGTDIGEDLVATQDGGYIIAGYNAIGSGAAINDLTIYKVNGIGIHLTNQISGRVAVSEDGCNPVTPDDPGLNGWLVRAEKPGRTFYGSTDVDGHYNMIVDTGEYMVTLIERNPYWEVCNPVAFIVDFAEEYDSTVYNFSVRPEIDCPLLEVNITTTPISACSAAEYRVRYCNQGPSAAENSRVEIVLDDELTYVGSSLSPDSVSIVNDRIIFQLGTIGSDDCGSFSIQTEVACDGVLDEQAITVKAEIFPNEDCLVDWNGPSISVTANCDPENETISFDIENVGFLPIDAPLGYIVVEDQIMHVQGTIDPLDPQQIMTVPVSIDGIEDTQKTYRILVEQVDGHPGRSMPTIAVEGCTTEDTYTTGNYTQFPENDNDAFIDIDVQEVIDYGTAVVLQGHPKGYQDSIIVPTTDLEYLLVFANTGVDTVDRIVIRDTLPAQLDFTTLEMGPSSHPYDYELYDGGILKITFDNVQLLPGGSAGEIDSRGYVQFRLSQKPNNPVGTVITNRTAVFFDYQAPQTSNEERHVIDCVDFFYSDNATNCIVVDTWNPQPVPGVTINVYPNPFNETATFQVEGCTDCRTITLELHDILGRSVYREQFADTQLDFQRKHLPGGTYFYTLRTSGKVLSIGKLIITQ